MNEVHERVNAIKIKVLDVIESRVTKDTSLEELQHITFALNNIDEDKNLLSKLAIGFGGSNSWSPKLPETKPTETAE